MQSLWLRPEKFRCNVLLTSGQWRDRDPEAVQPLSLVMVTRKKKELLCDVELCSCCSILSSDQTPIFSPPFLHSALLPLLLLLTSFTFSSGFFRVSQCSQHPPPPLLSLLISSWKSVVLLFTSLTLFTLSPPLPSHTNLNTSHGKQFGCR